MEVFSMDLPFKPGNRYWLVHPTLVYTSLSLVAVDTRAKSTSTVPSPKQYQRSILVGVPSILFL